jgi:hypothetical protein
MRAVAIGSSAEAGSSIRSTSGFIASARAMQRRCCWPPERPSALSKAILHLVPKRGLLQRSLDAARDAASCPCRPRSREAVGDVVEDRLRERVRLLKDHADAAAHLEGAPDARRGARISSESILSGANWLAGASIALDRAADPAPWQAIPPSSRRCDRIVETKKTRPGGGCGAGTRREPDGLLGVGPSGTWVICSGASTGAGSRAGRWARREGPGSRERPRLPTSSRRTPPRRRR